MSSKPSESRSVPLSVREAAALETTVLQLPVVDDDCPVSLAFFFFFFI